jgi:hypothetical protein
MERSPVGARHLGDLLLHVPTVAPKQVGQVLLGEGLKPGVTSLSAEQVLPGTECGSAHAPPPAASSHGR